MKLKQFLFFCTSISLLSSLLALIPQARASASFRCGPHLTTYAVRSLSGASGQGVRCVRFNINSNPRYIIWYGEGYWGSTKYRHIGEGIPSGTASAGDIFGNGEDTIGRFLNNLTITFSSGNPPRTIRVTGAWNEEWILETDNVAQNYTSPLSPVRTCGPNFGNYLVRDTAGQRTGGGVRCHLIANLAWYGEGDWNGTTYAHIGIHAGGNPNGVGDGVGAFDICEPSRFRVCNSFRQGTLEIRNIPGEPFPACRRLTGAWNEIWIAMRSWENFNGQWRPINPPEQLCLN